MLRLNKKHLNDLLTHVLGIVRVVSDAGHVPDMLPDEPESEIPVAGIGPDDFDDVFPAEDSYPLDPSSSGTEPESQPSGPIYDEDEDGTGREAAMGRLCGRWETRGTRGDIEISRRGKHFLLTYLKRNGAPTEDRYVLLWNDGEIYYHCPMCRITVLALDGDTETLMLSPGVDYTRVSGYYNIR